MLACLDEYSSSASCDNMKTAAVQAVARHQAGMPGTAYDEQKHNLDIANCGGITRMAGGPDSSAVPSVYNTLAHPEGGNISGLTEGNLHPGGV